MLAKLSAELSGRINPCLHRQATPTDFSGRISKEKGLILTITIIFVLIIVIMAGVALLLMTNHAGITESQTRRMRAIYAAESGALTQAYEELRTNTCLPTTIPTIPPNPPSIRTPCFPGIPGNFVTTINSLKVTVTTEAPGGSITCPPGAPGNCVSAKVIY